MATTRPPIVQAQMGQRAAYVELIPNGADVERMARHLLEHFRVNPRGFSQVEMAARHLEDEKAGAVAFLSAWLHDKLLTQLSVDDAADFAATVRDAAEQAPRITEDGGR